MKTILCVAYCVFFLSVIGGCATEKMILEAKDAQFFKVEVMKPNPTTLKISGLAFHSALAVEKITTETRDSSQIVRAHLAPARKGMSGSFEYQLVVPDSVTEVKFGNQEKVIWKRQ